MTKAHCLTAPSHTCHFQMHSDTMQPCSTISVLNQKAADLHDMCEHYMLSITRHKVCLSPHIISMLLHILACTATGHWLRWAFCGPEFLYNARMPVMSSTVYIVQIPPSSQAPTFTACWPCTADSGLLSSNTSSAGLSRRPVSKYR